MSGFVQAFSGSHRYVIDYLVEEVLNRQSEDVRTFLCRTSILSRLCAPLCDAVTGRYDSRTILSQLEQANLFVTPLDDQREWFRYHHLFADFLRTEINGRDFRSSHESCLLARGRRPGNRGNRTCHGIKRSKPGCAAHRQGSN